MSRVSKTRLAELDLGDIWFHIALDNLDAADRVLNEIDDARAARATPANGSRPAELAPDLRPFPVKPYILFYRPDAGGIELVRALDGSRNVEGLFDPDIHEDR